MLGDDINANKLHRKQVISTKTTAASTSSVSETQWKRAGKDVKTIFSAQINSLVLLCRNIITILEFAYMMGNDVDIMITHETGVR